MQPERRALIVAAHLEPTEPGDRFPTAIDVQVLHRATEILDSFGGILMSSTLKNTYGAEPGSPPWMPPPTLGMVMT